MYILYLLSEFKAFMPPAATAIATDEVAVDSPSTETAPAPIIPLTGAPVPPLPKSMATAMPIAPIAIAQRPYR